MRLAERHFERHGALTVFVARFVLVLRVVAGPAAGASGMGWGRFVVANAAGAFCWAVAMAYAGHYAGHAWEAMRHHLGHAAWVVLGLVAAGFVVWKVLAHVRKRREPPPVSNQPPVLPAD